MIFLWDETKDLILASKYDPLKIGMGEAGIARPDNGNNNIVEDTNSSPSKGKRKKSPEEEAKDMMKTVVNLFYEKEESLKTTSQHSVSTMSDSFGSMREEESLSDLIKLHDMYMGNLKFHKENGTLTKEREETLISKIDSVFATIEESQNKRKRKITSSDNCNNAVS